MKLMGDFFKVVDTSIGVNGFSSVIELNPRHVYTGHFPGHPVTPGVIQMQIIHELLEDHFGRKLSLLKMPQCKFLKVLDPRETNRLKIFIEFTTIDDLIHVKARGENEMAIFFKLNALYQFRLLTT
jgi:3-hydroxyacyl-[acyl-carrier-protein] dehydratase